MRPRGSAECGYAGMRTGLGRTGDDRGAGEARRGVGARARRGRRVRASTASVRALQPGLARGSRTGRRRASGRLRGSDSLGPLFSKHGRRPLGPRGSVQHLPNRAQGPAPSSPRALLCAAFLISSASSPCLPSQSPPPPPCYACAASSAAPRPQAASDAASADPDPPTPPWSLRVRSAPM